MKKIAFTGNVYPFGKHIAYGGERILYYLANELASKGFEIYVFAKEGTQFGASDCVKHYIPVGDLTNDRDVHYEAVQKYEKEHGFQFDLYHCNYFGDGWDPEVCEKYPYVELTWCRWCHIGFQLEKPPWNTVSYSKLLQADFMRLGMPTLMIHYGIPENIYEFEPYHDGYACWIGKMEGGKAPGLAIQLAKAAGLKMVIMGPPYNMGVWREQVLPYLNGENVFWVRGVTDEQKKRIMSRAKVFISSNDNTWREHFGIVNVEALAMGVPVLGFSRIGQECAIETDELIKDGEHGFLLKYNDSNNVDEILEKGVPLLKRIDEIDRIKCREQFEKHFTAKIMGRKYEWLYNKAMAGERLSSPLVIECNTT